MFHARRIPTIHRRDALFGVLLFATPGFALAKPCQPPRVLFVCPAGTVKSAIAREALKARAAQAGLPVLVQSRGLHVENHVSPSLAANLRADGIDPAAEPARQLQDSDVGQADIVIAFDEAAQAPSLREARAWDVPSWNSDYSGAKAALGTRIDELVVELRNKVGRC